MDTRDKPRRATGDEVFLIASAVNEAMQRPEFVAAINAIQTEAASKAWGVTPEDADKMLLDFTDLQHKMMLERFPDLARLHTPPGSP